MGFPSNVGRFMVGRLICRLVRPSVDWGLKLLRSDEFLEYSDRPASETSSSVMMTA